MTVTKNMWLALAREAGVRAGEAPSAMDVWVGGITGDFRDTDDHLDWAWEVMEVVEQSPLLGDAIVALQGQRDRQSRNEMAGE